MYVLNQEFKITILRRLSKLQDDTEEQLRNSSEKLDRENYLFIEELKFVLFRFLLGITTGRVFQRVSGRLLQSSQAVEILHVLRRYSKHAQNIREKSHQSLSVRVYLVIDYRGTIINSVTLFYVQEARARIIELNFWKLQ